MIKCQIRNSVCEERVEWEEREQIILDYRRGVFKTYVSLEECIVEGRATFLEKRANPKCVEDLALVFEVKPASAWKGRC